MSILNSLGPLLYQATSAYGGYQTGQRQAQSDRKEQEERQRKADIERALLDLKVGEANRPTTITMNGREFPDTPEGRQAAIDWRNQIEPPKTEKPEVIGHGTSDWDTYIRRAREIASIRGSGSGGGGGNWTVRTDPDSGRLIRVNEDSGQWEYVQTGGGTGAGGGTARTRAAQSVFGSLDDYEGLVQRYMDRGVVARGQSALGLSRDEDAGLRGGLESAHAALLMEIKEMVNLGVLTGPDVELVNDIIGDATSWESLRRNPEYSLSQLRQARQYLARKAQENGADMDAIRPYLRPVQDRNRGPNLNVHSSGHGEKSPWSHR